VYMVSWSFGKVSYACSYLAVMEGNYVETRVRLGHSREVGA